MIDITQEDPITLGEVTRLKCLPKRGGKRPHVSTIHRWAATGLGGVRLETIRIGGSLCTSTEALKRFFARLTAMRDRPPSHARAETSDRVEAALSAEGL